ncbi:Membrane associated serine protease, rhomboid family [Rubritalea squalenifaciens DSM 18772]|uniref:Membrane associated serine protease, rhomboid family n=1 Tax=Rubritalea squalenifaciens DSM 18772 TaxID=1123071 RepID=A0A1M6NX70_9BACT|nr:rhomboid family intramembrane serine protease [Rubritalea squalenifaciens]SHK00228.1 Membrane associated serine protease, rhomboid family [Rubritalea squalenifaciens DSM 18772]
MQDSQDAPVWAQSESFPAKPDTGVFGFVDVKGNASPCENLDDLSKAIESSKLGIEYVWTPEHVHLLVPEELDELRPVLVKRQQSWARQDIQDGQRMTVLFGAVLVWAGYSAFTNGHGHWRAVWENPTLGISAILLLIFGLIPWYEGWKVLRKKPGSDPEYWSKEIGEARFDSWISRQKAPVCYGLLAIMLLTGVVQYFIEGGLTWGGKSLRGAGLLKGENIEWWRYFTAPLLHGHLVHWVMNFAALKYLARRAEVLSGWPHVVIVFLLSSLVGGVASATFLPEAPSVGASGGILGILGFLLVFETLHFKLVPRTSRRRLLAGVGLVALMGILGFSFVDNAAHAGGLFAGMVYAGLVFPPTKSPDRPRVLLRDKLVGLLAAAILVASAALCILKISA